MARFLSRYRLPDSTCRPLLRGGRTVSRWLLLLLLAAATVASAETWEWVDGQGTVTFTDDRQSIPRQYRGSARKLGYDVSAPPLREPSPPPAPGAEQPPESRDGGGGTGSPAAPAGSGPGKLSPESYGGRTMAQWQEAFNAVDDEIREVDQLVREKQRLLKEPVSLGRSDYLKLEEEVRQLGGKRSALLARWESLKKEASAARLPIEWKQ